MLVGDGGSIGLAIISAVIAAAAAAVAVWRSIVARQQAQEARKSRELSAVISLFNAHQSEDASRMRGSSATAPSPAGSTTRRSGSSSATT
jgi:hypothetical protein